MYLVHTCKRDIEAVYPLTAGYLENSFWAVMIIDRGNKEHSLQEGKKVMTAVHYIRQKLDSKKKISMSYVCLGEAHCCNKMNVKYFGETINRILEYIPQDT